MNKKNLLIYIIISLIVLFLIPLTWFCSKGITINWIVFTEEYYKILLSYFVSPVLFGFLAYLLIEEWKSKKQNSEIKKLIIEQKKIAGEIFADNLSNDLKLKEKIKMFVENNIKLINLKSPYLLGTVKSDIIIEQMNFYLSQQANDMLRKKAKDDIIVFCQNFKE
ncbi:MAG: hypothetical protein LBG92_09720 [Prevotellaceae bacterium]|jgi:phosphate/sulfate permease|nr:hypothetical protein [Prevotellaceae bacterium]